MSMISEQVKELREVAEMYEGLDGGKILEAAADTIEALSAKLQAANMEDVGGWIPCEDRLPTKEECGNFKKEFNVTVNANGLKTMTMEFAYETVRGREVCRWKWLGRISPWEVIAWQPLPEPYQT